MTDPESVRLRDYFEIQVANLRTFLELSLEKERSVFQEKFNGHQRALKLAAANLYENLEMINNLRQQVTTQEGKYATKEATTALLDAIQRGISVRFDAIEKDIRELLVSRAMIAGKASQNAVIFAWGIGAAGLITAVVSLLLRFVGK